MKDFDALHAQAVHLVNEYKKTEAALLNILQRIEETKGFRAMGFTSLFDYCVKALGLTESVALNFITVSRKAAEVPELKHAIETGELTVAKARKITAVITPENQHDWISKAETLTSRELEKEVARVNPQAAMPERAKYIQEDRLNLSITVSEELYKELKRTQDLECQRTARLVTLEETLKELVSLYRERRDPLKKAQRAEVKRAKDQRQTATDVNCKKIAGESGSANGQTGFQSLYVTGHIKASQKRKPIPATAKHQLALRDQGRCAVKGCGNTRWLQIHHKQPVSAGGDNSLGNLITLCHVHHQLMHEPSR